MRMLTVGEMLQRVAQNLQIATTELYSTQVIPRFMQDAYRWIWDAEIWEDTYADPFVLNVGAGTDVFTLDKKYSAIIRAFNDSTGEEIQVSDMETFSAKYYPQAATMLMTTGFNAIAGMKSLAVLNQPSVVGVVKLASTSNTDTTTFFIRGLNQNGEMVSETVALSAGAATSANQYQEIIAFSKTIVPSPGVVTMTDNASPAVTLGTIGQWDTTSRYRRYKFNGINTNQISIQCICKLDFVPFQNDFDYPFTNLDDVLPLKATAMAWREHRQYEWADKYEALAKVALGELREREFGEENIEQMVPSLRA